MSYRNIEVNGKAYKYTVGKTYTKIRELGVVRNTEIGTEVKCFDYDCYEQEFTYYKYEVRPTNIIDYIKNTKILK